MKQIQWILLALLAFSALIFADENVNKNKFRQLGELLPTPNTYRAASGAPGHDYWQQRADYNIKVTLDDAKQRIDGSETVTYHNNSPDVLTYLWLQLDQNVRAKDSDNFVADNVGISDSLSFKEIKMLHNDFDGGFKIESVTTTGGSPLPHVINKTMMRVDLPQPLKPGGTFSFNVKWWYNINDRMKMGGRSGYEYFAEDDNYLYTIAQFYPRMAMYNEVYGWQNKQFLGSGEFTLCFGDFTVSITVPADHIVGATGVLQNPGQVLTAQQQERFRKSRSAGEPVMIVTEAEARENEKDKTDRSKTWIFKAENVRDFGWASSRKFIWDAMGVPFGNRTVMAMSYYPKEGNPLWEQYSTKVVAHTLRQYSKHTFDYPYPTAISVNAKKIGMEYPMICFNYGRPEKDGTYSKRTKYGMIGVIIHEVGHNFFPMIVNSDERQWTWMDEGLNSFLQYLTEQAWEPGYPSRRGAAYKIVDYMKTDKRFLTPIMTNSESLFSFGDNAYGKPATALNILRETVMGRELFDFAFKTYAQRWMFKHPTPADLFRTMEDASGVDLDWFWRGWFFTTDHVDLAIDEVIWHKVDTRNPDIEKEIDRKIENERKYIADMRNSEFAAQTMTAKDTSLLDFYNRFDPHLANAVDRAEYQKYLSKLDSSDIAFLNKDFNYYEVKFSNIGGLVMPLILEFEYSDGSKEMRHIPAEIWRLDSEHVSKVFVTEKELRSIALDPYLETADVDMNNNHWPKKAIPSRFKIFKEKKDPENDMQRDRRAREMEKSQ